MAANLQPQFLKFNVLKQKYVALAFGVCYPTHSCCVLSGRSYGFKVDGKRLLSFVISCSAKTSSTLRGKRKPSSPPAEKMKTKKVLVPVGFGTEEVEAVIVTDVLRRAGAHVTVASVESQREIEGCRGLRIIADTLITSCENDTFDLVLLPGGMPGAARLRDSESLKNITKMHAHRNRLHGAISEAPAIVLDAWGLLLGVEVACHPQFTYRTSALWLVKKNVHNDGTITTARGPGNAMELALSFVEQLFGHEKCDEIQKDLVIPKVFGNEPEKVEVNAVEWKCSNNPRVLVPVGNGSDEMEVAVIVTTLRRASADVLVASIEDKLEIVGSGGVKFLADKLMHHAAKESYDLIVLPGGIPGAERLRDNKVLRKFLMEHTLLDKFCGAICDSPIAVLEAQGVLKGRKATAHPSFSNRILDQFTVSADVMIDGKLVTTKGPGTTMGFSIALVDKLFGHERAKGVAFGMVFNQRDDPDDEGFQDVI